jgi:hypothetical protein
MSNNINIMSNDICELLKSKTSKSIYCDASECKININSIEYIISHDDFIKCFNTKNNNKKSFNHVKIRKEHMTVHQRNMYEKRTYH